MSDSDSIYACPNPECEDNGFLYQTSSPDPLCGECGAPMEEVEVWKLDDDIPVDLWPVEGDN